MVWSDKTFDLVCRNCSERIEGELGQIKAKGWANISPNNYWFCKSCVNTILNNRICSAARLLIEVNSDKKAIAISDHRVMREYAALVDACEEAVKNGVYDPQVQ
jgi:hypothetical protein